MMEKNLPKLGLRKTINGKKIKCSSLYFYYENFQLKYITSVWSLKLIIFFYNLVLLKYVIINL